MAGASATAAGRWKGAPPLGVIGSCSRHHDGQHGRRPKCVLRDEGELLLVLLIARVQVAWPRSGGWSCVLICLQSQVALMQLLQNCSLTTVGDLPYLEARRGGHRLW